MSGLPPSGLLCALSSAPFSRSLDGFFPSLQPVAQSLHLWRGFLLLLLLLFLKYLFMRDTQKGRDGSRLHAGSPTWDSTPGLLDQAWAEGGAKPPSQPGCPMLWVFNKRGLHRCIYKSPNSNYRLYRKWIFQSNGTPRSLLSANRPRRWFCGC